ncbi:hypothetical protein [Halalkalibacter hemicellulosilyticus]|uniref:ABC transporter periplasmic binding protein yphF n=1 Tax=Halalkalibacter hemicellulosilyticusJCM 9152 TaxID=1236971 RepID=W4QAD2_9BACI|nr:hypothetical protein [Halalkalibacter hemicellulosilyticus]GAE29006.1 ABC transporter periplasmic binding protein yphF [Halalkalibacter hemicellulosilyticusJCM 9152]
MKRVIQSLVLIVGMFMLAGCFLPDDQRAENQIAYPDQLQSVQLAIDQFQSDSGVLPIYTFDEHTSLYNRYVVDFNQLVPRYLQQPPGTAFENGGVFRYALVNVEEEPEVKVIDLRPQSVIQQYHRRVNDYIRNHTYVPIMEVVDDGLFMLDYEELGFSEEPLVQSPYSEQFLPLLFTHDHEVIIDYRLDIYQMLLEYDHSFNEDEDLRPILYQHSPFVPARSVPYVLDENGEPIYEMSLRKK